MMKTISNCSVLGAVLLAMGCPSDDTGVDDETSGTTVTNTTATTNATPNDSTGPLPGTDSSGGASSGSDSSGSDSSGSDSSGTTTGAEFCEIMLPPPMACPAAANANPETGLVTWLPYDRMLPGMEPAGDLVDADDPEFGDGVGFIRDPDTGVAFECDPIAQDCPVGEKCMPWANDGGSWNATRCSDVVAMPDQIGEVCSVTGSGTSGIDTCDVGQMCWDVDAETLEGTCIELCSCSEDSPVCNTANTVCSISNGGALPLCLEVCNPLDASGCGPGQGCYPSGEFFQCAPDASGGAGAPGDPCEFINVCTPGTICVGPAGVPGCVGATGCCSSMCDLDMGGAECLAGQDCLPWYEAGAAPDACLGQVGACIIP